MMQQLLQIDEARRLDDAISNKGNSPILNSLDNPENALRFMRSCLRGSYLFGRFVVPSYLSHVFASLTNRHPTSNTTGKIVKEVTDFCLGELATNNVSGVKATYHAHYYDLLNAYDTAGGDITEFNIAIEPAIEYLVSDGYQGVFNSFWSEASLKYASRLMEVCNDPLQSFILMPCNERLTTIVYPVALKSLCREKRFDKFRHFMDVHIQLDQDDHSVAAMKWLEFYLESDVSSAAVQQATEEVLKLYEKEKV